MSPAIPISGSLVTQLRVDYAFTLSFDATVHLRLEEAFTVSAPGGAPITVTPGTDLGQMGFLLTLHQVVVVTAETDEQGRLRIAFADGRLLQCDPDHAYEAWTLSGPNGLLYVCLPGGGLAVWSASADQ